MGLSTPDSRRLREIEGAYFFQPLRSVAVLASARRGFLRFQGREPFRLCQRWSVVRLGVHTPNGPGSVAIPRRAFFVDSKKKEAAPWVTKDRFSHLKYLTFPDKREPSSSDIYYNLRNAKMTTVSGLEGTSPGDALRVPRKFQPYTGAEMRSRCREDASPEGWNGF